MQKKILDKKVMYRDEWITVEHEHAKVRGKKVLIKRYMQPDVVVVIPLLDNGKLILERQYRYAHGKYLYEFPAGGVEGHEKPLVAAERELREETGYTAKSMKFIFKAYMSTHNLRQFHFFYAHGLKRTQNPQLEPEEIIQILKVKPSEIERMIANGRIEDTKTITGYLYFKSYI